MEKKKKKKKQQLELDMEWQFKIGKGKKIGKGVHEGCILSPCLFNLYAEYIIGNDRLDETSWNQNCWEKYQPQICR